MGIRCGYTLVLLSLAFVLVLIPGVVLAAIPSPTTLQIQNVAAFQHAREDGDQLYIVTYYIDFATLPDEPVNNLFIFRLLDEDESEIAAKAAYPFYSSGYGMGVVAFYLSPDDAPEWQSGISVQVSGNPMGDWEGSVPVTTTDSITWNTGSQAKMQQIISAYIITLATALEQAWDVEMTTAASGMTILSGTGLTYFIRAIPYLREVAPFATGQYTFELEYPSEKPTTNKYARSLIEAIRGTIFDLSEPARSLRIPQGALTAALYYTLVALFFILLARKHKLSKGVTMLLWPFVIAGSFIGVPLIVTILGGLVALSATVWLIYKVVT